MILVDNHVTHNNANEKLHKVSKFINLKNFALCKTISAGSCNNNTTTPIRINPKQYDRINNAKLTIEWMNCSRKSLRCLSITSKLYIFGKNVHRNTIRLFLEIFKGYFGEKEQFCNETKLEYVV